MQQQAAVTTDGTMKETRQESDVHWVAVLRGLLAAALIGMAAMLNYQASQHGAYWSTSLATWSWSTLWPALLGGLCLIPATWLGIRALADTLVYIKLRLSRV